MLVNRHDHLSDSHLPSIVCQLHYVLSRHSSQVCAAGHILSAVSFDRKCLLPFALCISLILVVAESLHRLEGFGFEPKPQETNLHGGLHSSIHASSAA